MRCAWVEKSKNPLMVKYHDEEWGCPVHDDQKHFEFVVLESAQAGLSWEIILNRRENYRKAFAEFNPAKVAKFSEKKILSLLKNEGIIRNQLKIRATVTNAQAFLNIQKEFGSFDRYIWGFVKNKTLKRRPRGRSGFRVTDKNSDALSKDLKNRGFKFMGSTICYAHMQAIGLIDEHQYNCFRAKASF